MKDTVKIIVISLVSSLLAVGFFSYAIKDKDTCYKAPEEQMQSADIPFYNTSSASELVERPNFRKAADKTIHSVVHILTESTRKSSVYEDFFSLEDIFGHSSPRSRTYKATGSGVIISSDGYIITNNHVVENADKISITLNDKRTYNAKIIGTDPSTDLALIKVDQANLPFLAFGNSDDVYIGDWVLAVGNPFNLTSTVTAGIVSAKARNINILGARSAIESFIQTDAVVNKGNSGGALVDVSGKLVGINAAIASGTGYYNGYSFAIPANIAKKVVKDLKDYGQVQRAFLGVQIKDIDDKLAKQIKLDKIQGVYIQGVIGDGASDIAGIEAGDILLKVNSVSVNSQSELLEKTGQFHPGDKINIQVLRKGNIKDFVVELTNKNGDTKLLKATAISSHSKLGAKYGIPEKSLMTKLGIDKGVQIQNIDDGILHAAGVKEGFIILFIDKKPITEEGDINTILKQKSGGVLIEGIYPNGMRAYYGFGL